MDAVDAASWCDASLREWEAAYQELVELRFTDAEQSSMLRKARIKRAEEKASMAAIKANAATLVQQLMHDTDRGIITLDIPAMGSVVEVTWHERLSTTTE